MTHLNILVEGLTELRFIKTVLGSHLGQRNVFVYPIAVLTSKSKRASREYRGGVNSYRQVKADLLRLIKHDQSKSNAWFTMMIDLYRLPHDFPGYQRAISMQDCWQRVAHLEQEFGRDISCARFLPYIQLHEYEALILSAPKRFQAYYTGVHQDAIARLTDMVSRHSSPEEIDDSETTSPSKRIISEIPAYEDDKAHAGPFIAENIGLPILSERCPHFAEWLGKLENLGRDNAYRRDRL